MNDFDKIYQQLNPAQKEAVDQIDGPVMVLAGPGTGKTQLLSARVANILRQTDTPANAILCLTFTETGAFNMRQRLTNFIGQAANDVMINTYHGFAQTIINQHSEYFIEDNLSQVVDFISQWQFISEIIDDLPKNNVLKNAQVRDVISAIGEIKQAGLNGDDLARIATENKSQIEAINKKLHKILADFHNIKGIDKVLPYFAQMLTAFEEIALEKSIITNFKSLLAIAKNELVQAIDESNTIEKKGSKTKPLTAWKKDWLEKNRDGKWEFKDNFNQYRLETLAKIFNAYQAKMTANKLYDFNDMITKTIAAIEANPDLKFNLQEQYLYILLDEYQDTNIAQSRLIELLADNPIHEGRPNIMAVGDDDQAIYAFQGADYSNMLNFYQRYRDTKLINLSVNYRSSTDIIDTAKAIANQVDDSLANLITDTTVTKDLTAGANNPDQAIINRLDFANNISQNAWTAEKIAELIKQGEDPNEIAVLSPKHKFLESLAPFLASQNIPIRYEKADNILNNPGIKTIINLARLIVALKHNQAHNRLTFEVLSNQIWQVPTELLWRLNWQAKEQQQNNWFKLILDDDKYANLRPFVMFCLEFAKRLSDLSLAASFDLLIGNAKLGDFSSPLKQFYLDQDANQLLDFSLDLNLLREHFLDYGQNHQDKSRLPLELLIEMIDQYEAADEKILRQNSYNEQDNCVNLMTIFSAKGLEFKHVFLLEANSNEWGSAKRNNNRISLPANLKPIRHSGENINERIRLLFVAISRAKSHLYILNPLQSLTGRPTKRLEFLDEIEIDGQFKAQILPKNHQKIIKIEPKLDQNQLNNNLVQDFSAWQARHLIAAPKLQHLLQPKLDRFRLSPTAMNVFTDLRYGGPEKYFLQTILGWPSEFSLPPVYGSIFHATLDRLEKTKTDQPITAAKALETFKAILDDYDLIKADYDTIWRWANDSLPVFIDQRADLFTPNDEIKIESEVKFNSKHTVVGEARLTGTIDRLEINKQTKQITIIDFKTGKSRDKIKGDDISLYQYIKQLYFYKLLLLNSPEYVNYQITNWRLEFVEPDRHNRINAIEGEFDNTELERVKRLIEVIWDRTQNLDFSIPEVSDQVSLKDIKAFEQSLLD